MDMWEIHPALVHFPLAFFLGGVALDLYDSRRPEDPARVATGLMLAGVVTGTLAALAGVLAFYTVPSSHTEEAHTLVLWHLGCAVGTFLLFTGVAVTRWQRLPVPPSTGQRLLGVVAAILLLVAGALGGRIVYHGAMGIDPKVVASDIHHHFHSGE
jgi:uncharacterized membrane protein